MALGMDIREVDGQPALDSFSDTSFEVHRLTSSSCYLDPI